MNRDHLLPASPPRDLDPATDDGCRESPDSITALQNLHYPRTSGRLSHTGIDGHLDIYLSSVLKYIFGLCFVFICKHLTFTPNTFQIEMLQEYSMN